jgi:copper chaperone CopZ
LKNSNEISFSVLGLVCIACTPLFQKQLEMLPGIKEVKPTVMMNMISVEIDPRITTPDVVKKKVLEIAAKAGLKEKIIFHA